MPRNDMDSSRISTMVGNNKISYNGIYIYYMVIVQILKYFWMVGNNNCFYNGTYIIARIVKQISNKNL